MRVVIALGGNALLRRGQPPTVENQLQNVVAAAEAIAPIVLEHATVISHGNGPQVGLLALQGSSGAPEQSFPLDVLNAQTEGMIGYLVEQELANVLPPNRHCVTLVTRVEVRADDPAFVRPSKPIGAVYSEAEGRTLAAERGWTVAPDGAGYRRVVPSPKPTRIVELDAIRVLVDAGYVVICAGGGGIPTVRSDDGTRHGVPAVIDKDLASGLLATEMGADTFLMLTDVDAVYENWPARAGAIRRANPAWMRRMELPAGSMGPKVEAAIGFAERSGGSATIGPLTDAASLFAGEAGTTVTRDVDGVEYW